MATTCKHCGAEISGWGANNAVLCIPCWARLLVRVQAGETQTKLAQEYGVSKQAISRKLEMYG